MPDVPEMLEVEAYRRLAEGAVGRPIASIDAADTWFLKGGITSDAVRDALVGRRFSAARRVGKLLLMDLDLGPTVGLRFGMTGRLLVDDAIGVNELQYSSHRLDTGWDRFVVHFDDGGDMRINDPRRLGGVLLDPDEAHLGPDAAAITYRELADALDASTAPLKARLMDQRRVAGLGNLLTDETLWRAGLDPARAAGSLSTGERRRLHRHIHSTVAQLDARGGSHTGDLQLARVRGGRCPKDGAELARRTVGGRTTYSCPVHQS
ncbi:MAG: formamidopyrimidine-DNA glycosylase [Acidimicrobiaceae bacterium]|jgi:formamidopyrimidine-DNA glycosylase